MAIRELLPLRRLFLEIHKNSLINTPLEDHPFSRTVTSHLEPTRFLKRQRLLYCFSLQQWHKDVHKTYLP